MLPDVKSSQNVVDRGTTDTEEMDLPSSAVIPAAEELRALEERTVWTERFRCIRPTPSSGSSARIRTPAPTPAASLETLSIQETP